MQVGDKLGRWTLMRYVTHGNRGYWNCRCDCGQEKRVRIDGLQIGRSQSCGCLMREQKAAMKYKHGGCDWRHGKLLPEWRAWKDMRARCSNPNRENYPNYGGRGIKVCERWQKFENFYADMGPRPKAIVRVRSKYSIERRDNGGNYTPENCYWATVSVQNSNRRSRKEARLCRERQLLTSA